jgi:hypothetical protein
VGAPSISTKLLGSASNDATHPAPFAIDYFKRLL